MSKLADYLFHEEPGITLYCGDCRIILPLLRCPNTSYCLEACDGRCGLESAAVVTDPPYGVSAVRPDGKMGGTSRDIKRWRGQINPTYAPIFGDDKPIDPSPLLAFGRRHIIWGGNYIADRLPPSPAWLVWYKRINGQANDFADCELAWTDLEMPARVFQHLWMGMLRDSERGVHDHPTQKPTALISWCLSFVPDGVIIDPYAGSGTTLEAAKSLNRRAIGIEISPDYCEIAVKRLRQEVLAL